ncbi:MAG: DNA recombination protein RmuC [bacterium]
MVWVYVFIGVLALCNIILLIYIILNNKKPKLTDDSVLNELKGQIQSINQNFFSYLQNKDQNFIQQLGQLSSEVNKQIGKVVEQMFTTRDTFDNRLGQSNKVLADLQHNLGIISQVSQRIFDVGKDVTELQEILKTPKLRGIIGEVMLEELLSEILPKENFKLQYHFNGGEIVDAIISLRGRLLPVDAKFPLENFQKIPDSDDETARKQIRRKLCSDVKKHIESISSKYIKTNENTLDCAFMYIPAENIYYDLFIKTDEQELDLNRYAFKKKVIPVSPNTFFAFLQLVLFGLKGLHIEENAKYVLEQLLALKNDLSRFISEFEILGKHVVNVKNKYDDSQKHLDNFSEKLDGLEKKDPDELEVDTEKIKVVE